MKMKFALMAGMAIVTAGCMTDAASAPAGPSAAADLVDASGVRKASAEVHQVRNLLRVEIDAAGLAPGTYGAHIHTIGRCDAPGFVSAGGHWNPTSRQHGHDNPAGAHMGDLPNLEVDAQGRGVLIFAVEQAQLSDGPTPLLDADGAAIVVHAQADDYRTDPTGNSGDRIACGVLRAAE